VAEQLHDDARVDTGGQQQGCRGVPAVVQTDVPNAGAVEQLNPDAPMITAV